MIERAIQAQKDFYTDRPVMAEANSVDLLIHLLAQEAQELIELPPSYIGREEYIKQELADIFLFAFALADRLAGDKPVDEFIASIVMEKISRNMIKYNSKLFNNGLSYEEAVDQAKYDWHQSKGNEEFYGD